MLCGALAQSQTIRYRGAPPPLEVDVLVGEGEPIHTDECIPTAFPIGGEATPVSPGQLIEFVVPDIHGRPRARIWEQYHEAGMSPPAEENIFDFGP